MLAGRRETKLVIEGGHAVNIDLRDIQTPCNHQHGVGREITKLFLNLLQDGNEVFSFAPYSFE